MMIDKRMFGSDQWHAYYDNAQEINRFTVWYWLLKVNGHLAK